MDKETTSRQIIFDIVFGILVPIICLIFDPIVFRGHISTYLVSINLFAYSSVGLGIFTLSIWLLFKTESTIINSLIAGALLTGALLAFVLGIAILPYSLLGLYLIIGIFGFTPFLTAFVFLRNGIKAIRKIQPIKNKFFFLGSMFIGIVLVFGLPLEIQSRGSKLVSQSIETIANGKQEEVKLATKNLKIAFWCSNSCYDEIVWSYYKEENETKRQLISSSYRELTGENIKQKLYRFLALGNMPSVPNVADEHNEYYNQGLSFYETGDYDPAVSILSTAIYLDPEDSSAYLLRGLAYRYLYEYEKSLQDTEKVLELDPGNADAHHLRAINFFNSDRYEEAIAECTIALELDEYDKSPLLLRAFVYQNTGEMELALNDLEHYLVFIPDAPDRARIEGQIESIKTKNEK
jgi:hypothetical protein